MKYLFRNTHNTPGFYVSQLTILGRINNRELQKQEYCILLNRHIFHREIKTKYTFRWSYPLLCDCSFNRIFKTTRPYFTNCAKNVTILKRRFFSKG